MSKIEPPDGFDEEKFKKIYWEYMENLLKTMTKKYPGMDKTIPTSSLEVRHEQLTAFISNLEERQLRFLFNSFYVHCMNHVMKEIYNVPES